MAERKDHKRNVLIRWKQKQHCAHCSCQATGKTLIFVQNGNEIRTVSSITEQPWGKILSDIKQLEVMCTECYKEQNQ